MAHDIQKRLAGSLDRVKAAARKGIIQSSQMNRVDRERLLAHGCLMAIIKGWYLLTQPQAAKGESTVWFASFWDFLDIYLSSRFSNLYCLSAESSLRVHLGSNTIPKQVVVTTKRAGQTVLSLPHNTSLLVYADKKKLPGQITNIDGLNVMSLPLCLCRITPEFFKQSPREAEIALRLIRSGTELSKVLVEGGYVSAAERVVGAYHFLNEEEKAQAISEDMKSAGFRIVPKNPFEAKVPFLKPGTRIVSPYEARIKALWESLRNDVLSVIPEAPGTPKDKAGYFAYVDELYRNDAYHSLSIEGYRVTQELIERIRSGAWDPESDPNDRRQVDALAAKGYLEAFGAVKASIKRVFEGESPGRVVSSDLQKWYRALFSPAVYAGLIKSHDLIGYRNDRVFIKGSKHVPPPYSAVVDSMEAFFSLLIKETEASVKAVLGHFLFAYIHPYMDGNGRIARFLMNVMLASGGYPWTVIHVDRRSEYMSSLEVASVKGNIRPFVEFLYEEMQANWNAHYQ